MSLRERLGDYEGCTDSDQFCRSLLRCILSNTSYIIVYLHMETIWQKRILKEYKECRSLLYDLSTICRRNHVSVFMMLQIPWLLIPDAEVKHVVWWTRCCQRVSQNTWLRSLSVGQKLLFATLSNITSFIFQGWDWKLAEIYKFVLHILLHNCIMISPVTSDLCLAKGLKTILLIIVV